MPGQTWAWAFPKSATIPVVGGGRINRSSQHLVIEGVRCLMISRWRRSGRCGGRCGLGPAVDRAPRGSVWGAAKVSNNLNPLVVLNRQRVTDPYPASSPTALGELRFAARTARPRPIPNPHPPRPRARTPPHPQRLRRPLPPGKRNSLGTQDQLQPRHRQLTTQQHPTRTTAACTGHDVGDLARLSVMVRRPCRRLLR